MIFSIEELYELSKDRKLDTPEIHKPNDFYGHAALLKKYTGLPSNYQLKAAIEHGPFPPTWAWDMDINSLLPAMLIYGPLRYQILKEKTNKALFSIGPTILYASHYMDAHTLSMEKKRIGKMLLVFPNHSTHHVDAYYDIHKYCRRIEQVGKEFDTVMICIYWKDVLRGVAETYIEHGFECVTAGHMYDPRFLSRLKCFIELATVSASANTGTQIPFCIAMGKPHFLLYNKAEHRASVEKILKRDIPEKSEKNRAWINKLQEAFAEIRSDVSQNQVEIANRYWGMSEYKTSAEMESIFQVTEDMWKKTPTFFKSSRDVLIEQALEYLNSKDNEKALFLLERAIVLTPDMPELKYAVAVALLRLGRIEEARTSLADVLRISPDHEKGLLLLREIKKEFGERDAPAEQELKSKKNLKKQSPLRLLNLGCGYKFHPAWVNVDFQSTGKGVIAHNLTKGVPFEKNAFDVVYHSHVLEHFPKNQAGSFLQECFRVLDVGGVIRVAVPDLEQIARHYLALLEESIRGDEEARKKYEWIMLELFDQMVRNFSGGEMGKYFELDPVPAETFVLQRMGSLLTNTLAAIRKNRARGVQTQRRKNPDNPMEIGRFRLSGEIHQWMYDRYSLGKLLREAGFTDVTVCLANESQIPKFNSYLLDIERNGSVRKPDSLFMEGVKGA